MGGTGGANAAVVVARSTIQQDEVVQGDAAAGLVTFVPSVVALAPAASLPVPVTSQYSENAAGVITLPPSGVILSFEQMCFPQMLATWLYSLLPTICQVLDCTNIHGSPGVAC